MDITEEEEIELRGVFDMLDKDGSGAIDSQELMKGVQMWGMNPTSQEVEESWMQVDMDNSGTLSFDEFKVLLMSMKKSPEQQEAELDEAIDTMMQSQGLENSETMSKADFKEFLMNHGQEPLTDEDIDELFRDLDQDGDAETLNRRELVALFTRKNFM